MFEADPASVLRCEAKTEGLVRYPTTLAPASGTQSVTTQCADNAHRTSSSLSVTCNSSGIWGGQTPQCQCDSGYQTVTVNGRQICRGSYTPYHRCGTCMYYRYIVLCLSLLTYIYTQF